MRYFLLTALCVLLIQTCFAGNDNKIFGRPFKDGSPSCTSCHSIVAAGYKSSTYGPDISSLVEDMGDDPEVIIEFIKTSGVIPMDAAYGNSNITNEEMKELIEAFTKLNTENVEEADNYKVILYAFIVFVVLLLLGKILFKQNSSLEENI